MLDIDDYFHRIGYSGSRAPTLDTLRALHAHHPLAIPFENLDSLCRRPIRLDLESLQRKLVGARRGGYCFEQNLFFSHVLTELGFRVTGLAARVLWERPDEVRARTHMLLFVQLGEGAYLCDVGFGGLTMTAPLRLEPDVEQGTPHETFRVLRDGREFLSQARVRGEWRTLYRFDLQQQLQVDIDVLNFYVSEHPDSPFLSRLMAARRSEDRSYSLRDNQLTVHHSNGQRDQRELASVAELRAVLAETFGIDVPMDAELDAALERLLPSTAQPAVGRRRR
jgi:N-hydroxyarylamine O-acetyltransferase